MPYDLRYSDNITSNEDMLLYKGIDLNAELVTAQVNDTGDDPSARAINDVELWLIDYINLNYSFDGNRSDLSDFQKQWFKRAVCEQIDYILDNGDLRNISGINQETGVVIDSAILSKKGLSETAKMALKRCGLANLRRY